GKTDFAHLRGTGWLPHLGGGRRPRLAPRGTVTLRARASGQLPNPRRPSASLRYRASPSPSSPVWRVWRPRDRGRQDISQRRKSGLTSRSDWAWSGTPGSRARTTAGWWRAPPNARFPAG